MSEYINYMRQNNYTESQIATFRNIVRCIDDELSTLRHSRRFATSVPGSRTDFRIIWSDEGSNAWKLSVDVADHGGNNANIGLASVYTYASLPRPTKEGPSLFCSMDSTMAKDLSTLSRQMKRFKVCIKTGQPWGWQNE